MNWFESLFFEQSALQAVCVISVIIAIGLGLGKLRICGISLGVTFVFFTGIMAGHFGLAIDPAILKYAEDFGLMLFVYELGLKVGPGFFSSFRTGGLKLNMLGLGLVLAGTATAIALSYILAIPMTDMVGILSGATTNTPSLGAAQQAINQLGLPAEGAALSCAVTYPLGVVGVIIAFALVRKFVARKSDYEPHHQGESDNTYVAEFHVTNPGIGGLTLRDIHKLVTTNFVISRIWHGDDVSIPGPDDTLSIGDRVLVITTEDEVARLTIFFGEKSERNWNKPDINWDTLDKNLVSRTITISKPQLNGRRLDSLKLRKHYAVNISRVSRSGIRLLARPNLILQLGDRLTIVGTPEAINKVGALVGNSVTDLKDPNLAAIFIGMVLSLIAGSIPITIPGISVPIKLGLAGGPIVVGILIGRFGPHFHMVTYTTRSANLMLRGIGLSLFLACLGLDAGGKFLDTIMRADGLIWIAAGFIITLLPSLVMTILSMRLWHLDFGSAAGMVSGAMANPMSLTYANEITPGDDAPVAYATTYPLSMFARVVIVQLLIICFV
ncbi:putative transporter [Muribaculum intestinale]|uniref:Transporter n=1 Tax=Muribaculum intestinale TaxID=1796646 RepID=A0A1B1SCK7_9BACT|nr:putative transporter [Muribaculum intestinale]ROS81686.1 putative transporter [Muribaculaceae bacterium Isolate-042 (Harlan)]GFI67415.1 aspartate/alanine antiporter [Muribaculaceae bacterium]ANU64440.1 transporter [Muribaculum intestinale]ASB37460.1 transporter [Muribaculum intestinale]MYM11358.1 putative transporter [Muribaculum intestinale]